MPISETLLEIRECTGIGYAPMIDYGAWRVAILRFVDELLPHRLDKMQRHDKTDEVFVLLAGRCILFIGQGAESVTAIHAQDMEPMKLYNVKRGCWHTHTLSEDAIVLIIENKNTNSTNSPEIPLGGIQRGQLIELTRQLWGKALWQSL